MFDTKLTQDDIDFDVVDILRVNTNVEAEEVDGNSLFPYIFTDAKFSKDISGYEFLDFKISEAKDFITANVTENSCVCYRASLGSDSYVAAAFSTEEDAFAFKLAM